MTFENFSRLTGALLLNNPAISSFEKVETNVKKVKRGDLFMGDSKEDIALAIDLEAYAIVTKTTHTITDNEIAWLQADSFDDILVRLLRFSLLEKKFRFIDCASIEIELIQQIADKEHLIFLESDEKENYKKIINADIDTIFFSSDRDFLRQIYPDYEEIKSTSTYFKHYKKSLFLSHFSYKERHYNSIKIAPLFLNHLENVVAFLKQNHISYEIEKCTFTSHFHPLFINKNLQLKSFGKSEQVVVSVTDPRVVAAALAYFKAQAPWAKSISFYPSKVEDLEQLKSIEFNFAIIVMQYDILIEALEKNEIKEQPLLFKE